MVLCPQYLRMPLLSKLVGNVLPYVMHYGNQSKSQTVEYQNSIHHGCPSQWHKSGCLDLESKLFQIT